MMQGRKHMKKMLLASVGGSLLIAQAGPAKAVEGQAILTLTNHQTNFLGNCLVFVDVNLAGNWEEDNVGLDGDHWRFASFDAAGNQLGSFDARVSAGQFGNTQTTTVFVFPANAQTPVTLKYIDRVNDGDGSLVDGRVFGALRLTSADLPNCNLGPDDDSPSTTAFDGTGRDKNGQAADYPISALAYLANSR